MPTITLRTEGKSMKKILELVRENPDIEIIPDFSTEIDKAWLDEVEVRKISLSEGRSTLVTDADAIYKAKQNLKK
mgnify:CR=1 FL=1